MIFRVFLFFLYFFLFSCKKIGCFPLSHKGGGKCCHGWIGKCLSLPPRIPFRPSGAQDATTHIIFATPRCGKMWTSKSSSMHIWTYCPFFHNIFFHIYVYICIYKYIYIYIIPPWLRWLICCPYCRHITTRPKKAQEVGPWHRAHCMRLAVLAKMDPSPAGRTRSSKGCNTCNRTSSIPFSSRCVWVTTAHNRSQHVTTCHSPTYR